MSNFKPFIIAAALGLAAAPAAFATSGLTPLRGEAGFTTHVLPASGKTRQQAVAELQAFKTNPFAADGSRYVSGETGWGYERRKVDQRGSGRNTPKPSQTITPQERRQFFQLYSGG